MTWQQIIALLESGTVLFGQIDPALAPTAAEIAALEGVASDVLNALSAQKGIPIDQVVAGLTPEAPIA